MAPPPIPKTNRPTGAGVMGMLYMIFGSLGVVGSIIGVAIVPLFSRISDEVVQSDPALETYLDFFASPVFPLMLAMTLVQSALVTAAGYGLWTMKPWGRNLGEIASWVWLATTLTTSAISYSWVQDILATTLELEGEPIPAGFESMMNAITIGSIVFNVILYGGLLGWAIYYLRTPRVKAAYGD